MTTLQAPQTLKLGRYIYERNNNGFDIYIEYKNFLMDGEPVRERRYSLSFKRTDDGSLYWSVYDCNKFRTLPGDKTPKTIAEFAHAVWSGSTIFEF